MLLLRDTCDEHLGMTRPVQHRQQHACCGFDLGLQVGGDVCALLRVSFHPRLQAIAVVGTAQQACGQSGMALAQLLLKAVHRSQRRPFRVAAQAIVDEQFAHGDASCARVASVGVGVGADVDVAMSKFNSRRLRVVSGHGVGQGAQMQGWPIRGTEIHTAMFQRRKLDLDERD
jgi:hypothetical protein